MFVICLSSYAEKILIVDKVGWSAMHYVISFAMEKKLRKIVPYVIQAGFDPTVKNVKNESAFDLARGRKNSKALMFLEQATK